MLQTSYTVKLPIKDNIEKLCPAWITYLDIFGHPVLLEELKQEL